MNSTKSLLKKLLFLLLAFLWISGIYAQKINQRDLSSSGNRLQKGGSRIHPQTIETKKKNYIEAVDPKVASKVTKITGYYGKTLNYPGNLAPFPTKSLQPYIKLKLWGIVDAKQANLFLFYLQEGPLTKLTDIVLANAKMIEDGATTEETVRNIMEWEHAALQSGTCDNHRDALSAEELIKRKCLSGCTDYTVVFAALARAKGISATVTETVSEKWIAEMVWANRWNPMKEGHFFSEVFIPEKSAWIVVDPTANLFTGRDNNGYFELNNQRMLLFERGLDPADYGLATDIQFANAVKKRYYVEQGDQP